jgi:DegV family protein with EDD domain
MTRVAIITDSASDMPPDVAARQGITVIPLFVSFGEETFRPNVTLTTDEFWVRMLAPDAPFPTTAAAPPGDFLNAFNAAFAAGAESVVCVLVSGDLSGTCKSAAVAAGMLADKDIRIVDSRSASMGVGLLAQLGAELAEQGMSGADVAAALEARKADIDLFVTLNTLEYLKRGGRISGAKAAIGTMLSIKPIITVVDGKVENHEQVRSRLKARDRTLELLTTRPVDRACILHTTQADVEEFRARFIERSGLDPSVVQTMTVGPSVGPHLGPGGVGAVLLLKAQ